MKFPFNNKILRDRRRDLRKNQTKAEEKMWQMLRNRKFRRLRFVRQFSVGPYILDFYCPSIRLAIELDGQIHSKKDSQIYDQERTRYLENFNIKVVRFKNEEVIRKEFAPLLI